MIIIVFVIISRAKLIIRNELLVDNSNKKMLLDDARKGISFIPAPRRVARF